MKLTNLLPYIAIAILLFFLWDAKCNRTESVGETKTFVVKEKTGVFPATKPDQKPIISRVIEWRDNPTTPKTENDTVNEKLLSEYATLQYDYKIASDSLKAIKYAKATQPIDFMKTVENDTIRIDIFGKALGEVKEVGAKWKIKTSKETVKIKTWRVLASGEVGANTKLDQFSALAGLIYQSQKGQQYSLKAGKFGSETVVLAGTAITIFKHSK